MNEEVNRPVISLVKIDARGINATEEGTYLGLLVRVKNIGKLTASIENITIKGLVSGPFDGCKPLEDMNMEGRTGDILPNIEELASGSVGISRGCEGHDPFSVYVVTWVHYSDATTKRKYSQTFVERMDVTLATLRKEAELTQPSPK